MRLITLVFTSLFVTCHGANGFPVGIFECGDGPSVSRVEIEKISAGTGSLPRLTVTLRQPELESRMSGMGLLLTIKDKMTGVIERRLRLPGSNVDLKYTETNELRLLSSSKRCIRKS